MVDQLNDKATYLRNKCTVKINRPVTTADNIHCACNQCYFGYFSLSVSAFQELVVLSAECLCHYRHTDGSSVGIYSYYATTLRSEHPRIGSPLPPLILKYKQDRK
jgi:hypothetical protein